MRQAQRRTAEAAHGSTQGANHLLLAGETCDFFLFPCETPGLYFMFFQKTGDFKALGSASCVVAEG